MPLPFASDYKLQYSIVHFFALSGDTCAVMNVG